MKETILSNLYKIEKEQHVKILYASETGSRAWGLANKESDYDVRFIYVQPTYKYLSIDPMGIGGKSDVIEVPMNTTLDMSGWDLTKALKLFRKSNPSLLEWLHTDIVYYENYSTIEKMREMEIAAFSSKPSIHHYLNMAKNNYRKCIQTESRSIKLYLNILRPILVSKWIANNNEFPPMNLSFLLKKMVPEGDIKDTITAIIEYKKKGIKSLETLQRMIINPFIEAEITYIDLLAQQLNGKATASFNEQLDSIFRHTLKEVWESNR